MTYRWLLLGLCGVLLATAAAAAGDSGIRERLLGAWSQARTFLTQEWASSPDRVEAWTAGMVDRHVATGYLAGRLLARTDPQADDQQRVRLAEALADWLAWRAANALKQHGRAWGRRIREGGAALVVQSPAVDMPLGTATVELRVGAARWDGLVQLRRGAEAWRIYDVEMSGVSLLALLELLWLEKRADAADLDRAIARLRPAFVPSDAGPGQ